MTVSLGPGSVSELVWSEGEDDADVGREFLRQEDLRGASLVQLSVGSLGQLGRAEGLVVLGPLLCGGDEPGGVLLGRLLGHGEAGQTCEEQELHDGLYFAMTSNEVKPTLLSPAFNTGLLGSQPVYYLPSLQHRAEMIEIKTINSYTFKCLFLIQLKNMVEVN